MVLLGGYDVKFSIDQSSGVPFYRQVIDQILYGIARNELIPGTKLPTVRQLAVDLSINPNTISKAYNELIIKGVLETQQGTGTFISGREVEIDDLERKRKLDELLQEFVSKASTYGIKVEELITNLQERMEESKK
jgi:GntR family transcriptional regulator